MTATFEIPDEVATRLREAADAKGISFAELVADALLREAARVETPGRAPAASKPLSPEEWSRKFHEFVESFQHLDLPPIPDDAWRRKKHV